MSADSPRATRFVAGLPASVRVEEAELPCTAHNISRTGLLLVGIIPTPDDDVVELTVRSAAGDLQLTALARVMRIDEDPDQGDSILGVEFLEQSPPDRPTLEALIARTIEGMTPAALERLPADATPQQIREALELVPLAHRIALAGRGSPRERNWMRHDSHLQVIDALARNPSILLHELLVVLRDRNVLSHTLEALARSPRWSSNLQLRVRVASHRNTPLAVATRIISTMPKPALQRVIQAPDLRPAVQAKVLSRLKGGR